MDSTIAAAHNNFVDSDDEIFSADLLFITESKFFFAFISSSVSSVCGLVFRYIFSIVVNL
jgi:hypothetical protein